MLYGGNNNYRYRQISVKLSLKMTIRANDLECLTRIGIYSAYNNLSTTTMV